MKFLKENWYKLMTGTAMLIFACGFFIYAVSPSYANEISEVNKPKVDYTKDDVVVLTSNGYLYVWSDYDRMANWVLLQQDSDKPFKRKLP